MLMKAFAMPVAIQMSIKWGLRYRYKYQCEKNAQIFKRKDKFLNIYFACFQYNSTLSVFTCTKVPFKYTEALKL